MRASCCRLLLTSLSHRLMPAKMSQARYFTRQQLTPSAPMTLRQQPVVIPEENEKKQGSKRSRNKRKHAKVDCQCQSVSHEDAKEESSQVKVEPFDKTNCPPIEESMPANQYLLQVKGKFFAMITNREPPLWQQQLANVLEMRKFRDAPVDTMGCSIIGDTDATPEVIIIIMFMFWHFKGVLSPPPWFFSEYFHPLLDFSVNIFTPCVTSRPMLQFFVLRNSQSQWYQHLLTLWEEQYQRD